MPILKNKNIPYFLAGLAAWLLLATIHPAIWPARAWEGIDTYYLRYDIRFTNNKTAGEKLTMVPANYEFRGENFSLFSVSNLIPAGPQASRQALEIQAKKNALKQIIEKNGLRSVKTLNHETMVTYEGMVLTPVDIKVSGYDEDNGGYTYTAGVHFAPLAFPDQWKELKAKRKMKELLNDFFLFFK